MYLNPYPRHLKDYKRLNIDPINLNLNTLYPIYESSIYIDGINALPTQAINCSIDTITKINSTSSVKLNSGSIPTNKNFNISQNFNLLSWIFIPSNINSITLFNLVRVNNLNQSKIVFSLTIDKLLKVLSFTNSVNLIDSLNDIRTVSLSTVDLNNWFFIQVLKYKNSVTIYVNNVELDTFEYDSKIYSGKLNIGGNSSTFNFTNLVINYSLYPNHKFKDVINSELLKNKLISLNTIKFNEVFSLFSSEKILITPNNQVLSTESVNNTFRKNGVYIIRPKALNVDTDENNSKGLTFNTLQPFPDNTHIEIYFELKPSSSNSSQSVIILSCLDYLNNGFYIKFNHITSKLEFIFLDTSLNLFYSIEISPVIDFNSSILSINLTKTNTLLKTLQVYLYGIRTTNVDIAIRLPDTLKLDLNLNVRNNLNRTTDINLYDLYCIENLITSTNCNILSYNQKMRYLVTEDNNAKIVSSNKIFNTNLLRAISINSTNSDVLPINFNIQIARKFYNSPNLVITIAQENISTVDTTYNIHINYNLDSSTDNVQIKNIQNISTGYLVITKGNRLATFNVTLENVVDYRSILFNISNIYISKTYQIDSLSTLNLSDKESSIFDDISEYVTALLKNEVGKIVSLDELYYLDSDFDTQVNTIYGKVIAIQPLSYGNSSPLYIKNSTNNIHTFYNLRTIFLIYKEPSLTVSKRRYVGNDNFYTFNGGIDGELVGDLDIYNFDFNKIESISAKIRNAKVSNNDDTIAFIDQDTQTLKVYQKDIDSVWLPTFILNLSTSELADASLDLSYDGTTLTLGLPSISVVYIYKYTTSWNLELSLSSPTLNQSDFGQLVVTRDNRLYVYQLSNSTLYIYQKSNNIWNATPLYSILFTGELLKLSVNETNNTFITNTSNNIFIYRLNTTTNTWSLSQTIIGSSFGISKDFTKLVIKSNNIVLYKLVSNSYNIDFTIVLNPMITLGDNICVSNSYNVALSDTVNTKVLVYGYDSLNNEYFDPEEYFTTGNDDYSKYIDLTDKTLLVAGNLDDLDIYSSDPLLFSTSIDLVAKNGEVLEFSDKLDKELNILTFVTSSDISINQVGSGKSGGDANVLNGYFMGLVLFSRALSVNEIKDVTERIKKYLNIREYAFTETSYDNNILGQLTDDLDMDIQDETGEYIDG